MKKLRGPKHEQVFTRRLMYKLFQGGVSYKQIAYMFDIDPSNVRRAVLKERGFEPEGKRRNQGSQKQALRSYRTALFANELRRSSAVDRATPLDHTENIPEAQEAQAV